MTPADLFAAAQQWLFESLIEPTAFALGLGNLLEDGFTATGRPRGRAARVMRRLSGAGSGAGSVVDMAVCLSGSPGATASPRPR